MFGGDKPGQDKVDKLKEVLGWVNDFVADDKFAAGTSQMTLADISLLATYSTMKVKPLLIKKDDMDLNLNDFEHWIRN